MIMVLTQYIYVIALLCTVSCYKQNELIRISNETLFAGVEAKKDLQRHVPLKFWGTKIVCVYFF